MVKYFRLLIVIILIFCVIYPVNSVIINPSVRSVPPGGIGTIHYGPGSVYIIYVTPTQKPVNYLTVEVSPPEATISIDGGRGANIDSSSPLTYFLSPGIHKIQAAAPGYKTHTEQVKIDSGDHSYVSITLERDPNYIETTEFDAKTRPAGASVYVDGKLNGTTPCKVSASVGTHTVVLRLEGYQEEMLTLDLTSTKSQLLSVQLVRHVDLLSTPDQVGTESPKRVAASVSPVTTSDNLQQEEPVNLFQHIIYFFRGLFEGLLIHCSF